MHEIHDCLTPRELTAISLRETGMSYRRMGEIMGYTGARAGKIYQKSCRKREKWIEYNAPQSSLLLKLLLPITNQIKELTK
jgi:hypothetical protein